METREVLKTAIAIMDEKGRGDGNNRMLWARDWEYLRALLLTGLEGLPADTSFGTAPEIDAPPLAISSYCDNDEGWRRILYWQRGELRRIKRRYNKRQRKTPGRSVDVGNQPGLWSGYRDNRKAGMADEGRKNMAGEVSSTEPEGGVGRQPVPKIELLELTPPPSDIDINALRQLTMYGFVLAFSLPARKEYAK